MKKLWLILIAVVMLVGMLMLIPQNAKALTEGVFTYTVSDGKATITACSTTTGDVVVPSTLGDYSVTSIGNTVFYNRSGLTSVTISEGITSIGNSAFEKCSGLTSIEIPSSVTSIGNYAFKGCSKLTSISIPNGVTNIGNSAFNGCSSLTSISISNGVTSIGDYVFNGCIKLTSVVIPAGVTSIGAGAFYKCSAMRRIEIPSSVTSIGNYAFQYCNSLTYVYYTGSESKWAAITIGANNECLTGATISYNIENSEVQDPDYLYYTVKNGEATITDCDESVSGDLVIPSTLGGYPVTSIGDTAFYGCSKLTSVEIPASVTSIDDRAFLICSSLVEINVSVNNTVYCSDNGILFNKSETKLICYPVGKTETSYKIPAGVTNIGDYAFEDCDSLTSVEIPASVTSIGDRAFSGCGSLTSVEIPASVTSIGDTAFAYCSSLKEINVGENNTAYCSDNGILFNKDKTILIWYPAEKTETSYEIPASVTSIGDMAFYNCSSLTSIEIPSSVTSIGDDVFANCSSLTSIEIPDGVMSIGNSVFSWCYNLTSIIIPDGVTSIGDMAFYNCSKLTSVEIPSSVTSIGNYAFQYCNSLTYVYYTGSESKWAAITIGANNECLTGATISYNIENSEVQDPDYLYYTVKNGEATITDCDESVSGDLVIPSTLGGDPVTSIASGTFEECTKLTSITIPDTVTNIGHYVFYGCDSLKEIIVSETNPAYCSDSGVLFTKDKSILKCYPSAKAGLTYEIPGSVTELSPYAFSTCKYVEKVVISGNLSNWYGYEFENCTSLKSVVLLDGITSIGWYVFLECSNLESIVIPPSVKQLELATFYGCTNLKSVYISDLAAWCGCSTASGSPSASPFCYGADLYLNGSKVVELVIPDGITNICDWAFFGCGSIETVEIPESVTYASSAFLSCSNLREINVSENNTVYCSDNGVLFDKDKTSLICYPAGKEETHYEIPNGVTEILGHAFSECGNLTSIKIPNSVTRIDFNAFSNCSSLTTVYYSGTEEEWNNIEISSSNDTLLKANIVYESVVEKPNIEIIEDAIDGTDLKLGMVSDNKAVIVVPTVVGNVAITEIELAEMLGDDITIISNNGVIGTGSKIIVGEQEVEIVVKGDIDGDGIATVFDALMVKNALAENSFTENDIREFAGDIDGEGVTDTEDVDAILAHIVGEMLIA